MLVQVFRITLIHPLRRTGLFMLFILFIFILPIEEFYLIVTTSGLRLSKAAVCRIAKVGIGAMRF